MNKPILFIDFDGTICHDRFWRGLKTNKQDELQKFLFQENKNLVDSWMRGKYISEEINQIISENINMPFEKLWDIFVYDCKNMYVPKLVLEKIRLLGDNFTTILITGNMDCFDRFTVPALKLDSYFDLISNSYNKKQLKDDNNGELFLRYADQFNANIEDSFVIDDSENVCNVFEGLGGVAKLITPEKDIIFHLENINLQSTNP